LTSSGTFVLRSIILATMHSITDTETDRQMDRRQYDDNRLKPNCLTLLPVNTRPSLCHYASLIHTR